MSRRAGVRWILAVSLFSTSVFAEEPQKEAPRKKVAVLDFTGDAKVAPALTRLVTAELGKNAQLDILSREDVTAILGMERQKQLSGCDTSCLTELGSVLDARWMVSGTVNLVGSGYLVTAQILDTSQARILNRSVVRAKSVDEVTAQAGGLARELLSEPATLMLYNQRPGAGVFLDDKFLGKLPIEPAPLSLTGKHSLRVEGGEFVPFQQDIELEAGRAARVSLELDTWGELEAKARARKAWATGFTIFGAAAGAASAAFFVHGLSANRTYQALDPLDATQSQLDAAADEVRWRFVAGYSAGGVAIAALVTGIILFVVDPYGEKLAKVKTW